MLWEEDLELYKKVTSPQFLNQKNNLKEFAILSTLKVLNMFLNVVGDVGANSKPIVNDVHYRSYK